jgi:hypothetical protein
MLDDPETIALRVTVIGGLRYADDYQVIWRGLSIGRIMKGSGVPSHIPQWWWGCNVYGKPSLDDDSGTGIDFTECMAKFMMSRIIALPKARAALSSRSAMRPASSRSLPSALCIVKW